jgi:asparagine synthase (glutamine-hydrolysing)
MHQYLERVVDLTDPARNQLDNLDLEVARARLLSGDPAAVRAIEGSFALVARSGKTVRLARSLDRPLRYFLAKRAEGPALVVADRIDAIRDWLGAEGLDDQFHPSYTRMVPAHHIVTLELIGCPDPNPTYTRFLDTSGGPLPADVEEIGRRYVGAAADEATRWLRRLPEREPVGVCFSGGIDSGAVFLLTEYLMRKLGLNLGRLKAFTLDAGDGPDRRQAQAFVGALGLGLFLEPIEVSPEDLDVDETLRVLEDYKPLDVESGTMALALCRGIRRRYPEWRYLIDGDGGDENLKDYPIEENPELTVRSVVHNPFLYQEGWGVGTIKHSLTYSGGLSRGYVRTYAPACRHGFTGFSPFTRPAVVELAARIPFVELTDYDHGRLYRLKGEIVSRGIKAITGREMPVFPKRRFQHGALPRPALQRRLLPREADYRKRFLALYA